MLPLSWANVGQHVVEIKGRPASAQSGGPLVKKARAQQSAVVRCRVGPKYSQTGIVIAHVSLLL
jgi:hypothetical protein